MAEPMRVPHALRIRLFALKMRAGIGGEFIQDLDDLVILVIRRTLHHELIALIREVKELAVLLIHGRNARQIVVGKLILHS